MKYSSSSPLPASPSSNPFAPPLMASRRDWCKAALGLAATAAMPFAARALLEQRQGWLLLSSDR
ncbi:MAG: hypothetical protein QM766_11080 [Burkholderiaceae bacterium]